MRYLLLSLLLVFSASAFAQQQCVCTSGCTLVSDPIVSLTPPTSCKLYKSGVLYSTGSVVVSSTIPISNATSCLPPDPPYAPGPPGGVACSVNVPPLAAGTYTLTLTAVYPTGESGQSPPLTFTSVAALTPALAVPNKPRVR